MFLWTGVAQTFSCDGDYAEGTGVAKDYGYTDVHVNITNLTANTLTVRVQRTRQNIPSDWTTTFCINNCYSATAVDVTDDLEPNQTAPFKVTFSYMATPGVGEVDYKVTSSVNQSENVTLKFKVETTGTSAAQSAPQTKSLYLGQNYPNPFSPSSGRQTIISYTLPRSCPVVLRVYNMLGQEVRTLINQYQSAGNFLAAWDGRGADGSLLPQGIYLYKLSAGRENLTRRIIIGR
jgi:hypothetical protein